MTSRPNFVVFITDQQRADMLGCAGDPLVRTPNIDAIAEAGTRFDRFYVAMPSCMPNRASIATSRLPSAHGVRVNGIPLAEDNLTFPELLRQAGYKTALVGKAHLQPFVDLPPNSPREHPDRTQDARKENNGEWWCKESGERGSLLSTPYYGFDHVALVTGHGDKCGGHYEQWLAEQQPDYKSLTGPENQLAHDYQCPQAVRTRLPEHLYSTHYIQEMAAAFLREHAEQDPNTPFLLVVSFPDPHHPFTPPGKYWDMYNPADVQLPQNFSNQPSGSPHLSAVITEHESNSANRDGYDAIRLNEQEAREAIALTCGMITMVDDAIGKVRDQMSQLKQLEKTVEIFTSDHGELLGDHGLMLKGPFHYKSLIRIACLIKDPDINAQTRRSEALCSSVDLGVSILERAGVAAHHGVHGISVWPQLTSQPAGRNALLIEDEYQGPLLCFNTAPRLRTLITERWRLTVFSGLEWGELYDLQNDPGECNNLWDEPQSASVRAELLQRLVHELIRTADTSPFPKSLA